MSRKRNIFNIDLPEDEGLAPPAPSEATRRRGPMASAIAENAESLRERREAETAIREENDRLAEAFVQAKREGMLIDRLPLAAVVSEELTRDRKPGPDPDLDELKASIREIGLSNPIRVSPRADGRYELVQGMRRLMAYRALHEETGEERFATIPAGILPGGEALEVNYRRMVDENMVRKDISFAEMASLARAYADDPRNDCEDVDRAVAILFRSASYPKRSYIRAFASLLLRLEKKLEHPLAIPRNVGVDLKRRMDEDQALIGAVARALDARPDRGAEEEVAILRSFAEGLPAPPASGVRPAASGAQKSRRAKTTFELNRSGRVAKCAASNGRVELRYDVDFTTVDRRRLERAVAAFIDALGQGG